MHTLQGEGAARDLRDLERLETVGDRLNIIAQNLEGFIARHNGYGRSEKSDGSTMAPVPSGYRGQLDRIFGLLDTLDMQANDIVNIG